jgi:hypothetical protein
MDYVFSFETAPLSEIQPAFDFSMDTGLTEFSTKISLSSRFILMITRLGKVSSSQGVAVPPLHIDLYRYPGFNEFKPPC